MSSGERQRRTPALPTAGLRASLPRSGPERPTAERIASRVLHGACLLSARQTQGYRQRSIDSFQVFAAKCSGEPHGTGFVLRDPPAAYALWARTRETMPYGSRPARVRCRQSPCVPGWSRCRSPRLPAGLPQRHRGWSSRTHCRGNGLGRRDARPLLVREVPDGTAHCERGVGTTPCPAICGTARRPSGPDQPGSRWQPATGPCEVTSPGPQRRTAERSRSRGQRSP